MFRINTSSKILVLSKSWPLLSIYLHVIKFNLIRRSGNSRALCSSSHLTLQLIVYYWTTWCFNTHDRVIWRHRITKLCVNGFLCVIYVNIHRNKKIKYNIFPFISNIWNKNNMSNDPITFIANLKIFIQWTIQTM